MANDVRTIEYSDKKSLDGTDYNDAPVGLREITEKEFSSSIMFSQIPDSMEYRQVLIKRIPGASEDEPHVLSLTMFWFYDKTGVGMSADSWKGKVRYFAFGCDHDFKQLSPEECRKIGILHMGHCDHIWQCQKCKAITGGDSSD